jgi:hypothetical protein
MDTDDQIRGYRDLDYKQRSSLPSPCVSSTFSCIVFAIHTCSPLLRAYVKDLVEALRKVHSIRPFFVDCPEHKSSREQVLLFESSPRGLNLLGGNKNVFVAVRVDLSVCKAKYELQQRYSHVDT